MEKLRPGEDMNAAIASLKDRVASLRYYLSCEHDPELEKEAEVIRLEMASLDRAIAVLRDWPRWAGLIRVAGKVDKKNAINSMTDSDAYNAWNGLMQGWRDIHALLAAIPEEK